MNNEEQILSTLQKLLVTQEQTLALQKQAFENQQLAVRNQQIALKNQLATGRIYRIALTIVGAMTVGVLYFLLHGSR